MSRLIVQFARAPVKGFVKTRMQPYLNPEESVKLHESLVMMCCKRLIASEVAEVHLWVDAQPEHPLFLSCVDSGVSSIKLQHGSNLGEKIFDCFTHALREHESVVLVGSDCPAIDDRYLREAFQALESAPLVFGPAFDGGYVLLGATEVRTELFDNIGWGGSDVLTNSLRAAKRLGLEASLLEALHDIDRPSDLEHYPEYDLTRH
tara:strand:+ start:143 stop:757 length:615 start_codon:yes stop_codon:yes gene_type:complete